MAGKEKRPVQPEPQMDAPVVEPDTVQHAAPDEELMCTDDDAGYLDGLMSTAPIDLMGPPAPPADAPVVDPEAQARQAAEEQARLEAEQAAADRKLAEDIFVELDDAMGVGAFDLTDPDKAQELLAGRSPSEMAAIRQYYQEQTGRTLEGDVTGQFGGGAENEMMANVLSGMSLRDQIEHYETSGSMENLIGTATPEQLAELAQDPSVLDTLRDKMDPQALMEARSKLFPDQKVDAVRERVEAANGYVDDDEGAVMAAMQTLTLDERREFLANHSDSLGFLNATERERVERMAESEAAALEVRMIQATKGAGTDNDAMPALIADTGRLVTEQRALEARLANGGQLSEDDKAQIEARLAELGDIDALLTPERNADGSLEDGSFLQRLEGDVGDDQLHGFMGQMGVDQREVSKQRVLDAIGFFNDDERGIQEAFADVPIEQRMALWDDPHVVEALTHLNDDEKATVEQFRDNDVAAMSAVRIDDANGWGDQDEAAIMSAVMDMNEDDRKAFVGTPIYNQTVARLDPYEKVLFDEAIATGAMSLDTAMDAATIGLATADELVTLAAERKSADDAIAVRRGYVLAQEGIEPQTPEDEAALALYQHVSAALDGDMDGDEYQQAMDRVLAHTTTQTDAYTGQAIDAPGSAEIERSTADGRMTASLLMDGRADEKMGPDGEGGGGVAAWFSDTDETAVQAHQSQKSAHYEALFDGEVTEAELMGHEALSEVFAEDYEAMVEAQSAIADAVATGASVVAAIAITLATSGAAGPAAAAFMAQYGTAVTAASTLATTVGTRELMGGARYDTIGEAGGTDAAFAAVDIASGHLGGKLGEAARNAAVGRIPGVNAAQQITGGVARQGALEVLKHEGAGIAIESTVDAVSSGLMTTVASNVADENFYLGEFSDSMMHMGGEMLESVPGSIQTAGINSAMRAVGTTVSTHRVNGLMDSLEAKGVAAVDLEALDMQTLGGLAHAQQMFDSGNAELASDVLGGLDLTPEQRATYAELLQSLSVPDAATQTPGPGPDAELQSVAPEVDTPAPAHTEVEAPKADVEPEVELTPEIQSALDPDRVDVDTEPASLIDSPELTPEERLSSAQKRVEAALDSGLDGPMAEYLVENLDNVHVLESVLDTHDTQFSSAARAHLPAITEAGVPRHYLDGMASESVELVGEAHRALANGNMDDALAALESAGLTGNEHDLVLAKLMEHNLGADALAGNEELATLAAFADTQNAGYTMDPEMAARNARKLVSSRNEGVLSEVLGTEAPFEMKASERASFYAQHMRDTLPADHPGQSLSDAELLGQLLYTSTMNKRIMDPMRTLDPDDLSEMLPVIQSATSAVNNMPEADQATRRRFRSSTGDDVSSMLEPGQVYSDNAFMSQSLRPDVTKFGNAYVLDIEQSTGSMIDDLSAYGQYFGGYDATEGEVLSRPGSRVEILSSADRDGTTYLRGRELSEE